MAQVFFCKFWEISKNIFLQNTSGRLLLVFLHIAAKVLKIIYKENDLVNILIRYLQLS